MTRMMMWMRSHAENEKKKQKEISRKIITKVGKNKRNRCQTQPETASAVVMKYLLEKKIAKVQMTPPIQQPNAIDTFFSSIAAIVKNFSPYFQNIGKSQIFSIITDLEMKQIMQEQPFFVPNTPTQHSTQMPLYHTGPYNVSLPLPSPSQSSSLSSSPTIQSVSPSSSKIATPLPSPSYDFSPTIPMPHLIEKTAYTENMKM